MVRTLATTSARHRGQDDSRTFSSRFFGALLLIFGVTIAWHHMLITSRQVAHDNGVGVSLEAMSNQVRVSTKLSAQQKEELIGTIRQLQNARQQQQQQVAVTPKPKTGSSSSSPYAYAFVIGGIHEDRPGYHGFIWDVLVAAQLLQDFGSTADVVVHVQMAEDSTWTTLPEEALSPLKALNVKVLTLPKPNKASFFSVVLEKFRILDLTQYRRVIFLDADAVPLTNMDYLFHLSDPQHTETPTLIQPNLIMASRGEPCNAGVFMLQPEANGWDQVQQIVKRQQEEGAKLPYPHFSWERGWGYDFQAENDFWQATVKMGNRWRFHAGFADQGLIYYWTKFHKRSVSIVIHDRIENWVDRPDIANKTISGDPKPVLQNTMTMEPLLQYSPGTSTAQFDCDSPNIMSKPKSNRPHQCIVPYRDFAHFMGDSKPWNAFSPKQRMQRDNSVRYNAATALWFRTLQRVNERLNMGIDFDNWYEKHHSKEGSPLGSMSKQGDIKQD